METHMGRGSERIEELLRNPRYEQSETGAKVRILPGQENTIVHACIGCGDEFPYIPVEGYPISRDKAERIVREQALGPPHYCGGIRAACKKT